MNKENIAIKALSVVTDLFKKGPGVSEQIKTLQDSLERIIEGQQESAQFDIYGQTNPGSTTSGVREQLYGKDLYYLRNFYLSGCAPIDEIIIKRFVNQARSLSECTRNAPKKIGWRVVAEGYDSPDFKAPKSYAEQCRWFEDLILNINKDRHPGGFKDGFLANVTNSLIFDRVAIEKLLYTGNDLHKGKPASYIIPDPLTIKPTTWALSVMAGAKGYSGKKGDTEAEHLFKQSDSIRDMLIGEAKVSMARQLAKSKNSKARFTTENIEERLIDGGLIKYVQQMQDKQIAMGWTDEEMSVFIANPQTMINANGWSAGSPFETSFAFKEVIWRATGMNQEIFDSKTPEGFLSIRKGGIDKKARKALEERMQEEGRDRFSNIMVSLVDDPDKDIKYVKTKDKPTDMQFKELFILYTKFILAAYGMDYSELNLEDGKSGGLQGAAAAIERMDIHKQTGIVSIIDHVANCYTQALILPWCKDIGMDFKMEFIYDTNQTKEQVELLKAKNAYVSINELRQEENLDQKLNIPPDIFKKNKEYFDSLQKYLYTPGVTTNNISQLLIKEMEMKHQSDMAKDQQKHEAEMSNQEIGEEGPQEPEQPEDDADIQSLQDLINGDQGGGEQPQEDMNKSLNYKITYDYT